jgi:ABC-2 type transport system permease protein
MSATAAAPAMELQEVKGPSAFGGDTSRIWPLVKMLAVQDVRRTYLRTRLGWLWAVLRPLLLFGVIFMFLRSVLRVFVDPVLLLLNIVLFQFFLDVASASVRSAVRRENLVRKMQFPRIVIPLSILAAALFTLAVNFAIVMIFVLASGTDPTLSWLLFPLAIVVLAAFACGLGMILSVTYVSFRDVEPAWGLIGRSLFYLSPILFTIETVDSETLRNLISLNPLAPILEQARVWLLDPAAPTALEAVSNGLILLVPLAIVLGCVIGGVWIYDRRAPFIAEAL